MSTARTKKSSMLTSNSGFSCRLTRFFFFMGYLVLFDYVCLRSCSTLQCFAKWTLRPHVLQFLSLAGHVVRCPFLTC